LGRSGGEIFFSSLVCEGPDSLTLRTARQHLLLAEAAAEAQRKGKPGQLVDPRPETVEGGEIKIRITPQLVHDIFDEYPVVAKAYSDNVPSKVRVSPISWSICRDRREWQLSEEEFWKRYFQSKLFNAHRASIRSSATQHVVKDDPIFDKYLERDDDGGLHDPHIVRSFLVVRRIGAKTTARRSSRYICRPSRHSRRSRRGEDHSIGVYPHSDILLADWE
jgi:hypothetical protein